MPETITDAENTPTGDITHETPTPEEITNPLGTPEDGETLMEHAVKVVPRVHMRDRDLPINEGLDLTTPIDNAPISQRFEEFSGGHTVPDHTHGKSGQPVHHSDK